MARHQCDVAVVGAGAAGLSVAIALAREGFRTCLVGAPSQARDGRTVALFDGAVRFLDAIGAWPAIAPKATPLAAMRIIDDTDNLFRAPPLCFHASEIDLPVFGFNVENADLLGAAAAHGRSLPALSMVGGAAKTVVASAASAAVVIDDGARVEARLVVGADGRQSIVRRSARIGARTWSYPQMALTTLLAHERAHKDTSTEFHTRTGPFTLVPLEGNRSSLVWVTSPAAAERLYAMDERRLARCVEAQAHSILGEMSVEGPRGLMPIAGLSATRLTGRRVALLGEAAHVFPPIGAQGLNLGMRDAAVLRDVLVDARRRGHDIGGPSVLARYARQRALDVDLRRRAVDGLNLALLAQAWPADLMRGLGMLALGLDGPLRRAVMLEGVTTRIATPRLMRA